MYLTMSVHELVGIWFVLNPIISGGSPSNWKELGLWWLGSQWVVIKACKMKCKVDSTKFGQNQDGSIKISKTILRFGQYLTSISWKRVKKPSYQQRMMSSIVATLGTLSRVFLFHFEKISGNFSLFWDVSVNTGWNSKFGLKKKKF